MGQQITVRLPSSANRDRWLVPLALVSLYLIWGSTYLGIAWAVKPGGFASFQLNAVRFVMAGLILLVFLRLQGQSLPTWAQTKNAALVGLFLIIGGNGLTTLALKLGAPSGISATVIATTPLWAGLWSLLWGNRPRKLEWLGMVVGIAGVAVLTLEGTFRSNPAIFIQFVAPMLWAFGSILSRNRDMPNPMMGSSIQMIAGGLACVVISAAMREPWQMPDAHAWAAYWYLLVLGSLVGFNAYIFLLGKVRPAVATSYAYVNPLVALFLGAVLAGETIGTKTLLALPIILCGVGIIAWAQNNNQKTT